jgi:hypothetical protein
MEPGATGPFRNPDSDHLDTALRLYLTDTVFNLYLTNTCSGLYLLKTVFNL